MNTIASRFMSFEEPLGAGLVKFAYFVIAAVLLILMVIAMIGGIVAMFEVGFFAGLGRFLLAPLQFVLALILLRIGTEVVLAILSIDDNLTDGARTEGAMPIRSPKQAMSGSSDGGGLPKSPDTSVTEASKDQNQRAPFTRGEDGKDVDTSETEASKDENQRAPFAQGSDAREANTQGSDSASSASASSGGAKSVSTAPAKKAPAKKATKKTAKKSAGASAASSASSASSSGGSDASANATSSDSAKKTAEAAKAATRPSGSDSGGEGSS